MMKYEVGFIGGGNMAEAIIRAAVDRHVLPADRIVVSDPSVQRMELFQSLGATAVHDNARVVSNSSQVVLAVKPQMLTEVAEDLKLADAERQVFISIMAGIHSEKIEQVVGGPLRLVRVMPNTPLLVGQGMSAVALGPHARAGDEALTMRLFEAGGKVIRVDEEALDAVTAVSGSGPAYVFYLAEAMIEAARSLGLSDEHASLLSRQTIAGAAKLMMESQDSPSELRRKVTSPGGTTQAALEHMEAQQVKQHIVQAIQRACERSKELGR